MQKILILYFIFFIIGFISPTISYAQNIDPQYIFVNKCPTCTSGTNYFYYYGQNQNISSPMVDEIINKIGTKGLGNRKLGISFILQYFGQSVVKNQETINKILDLSKNYKNGEGIPVLIKLDSHFWDGRPDLWNWWDPGQPGYDPNNKYNVEWSSWDPNSATKLSWYNWGSQNRTKPRANLGSPKVIAAKQDTLTKLLPLIVNWYNTLPDDKKYLLGGVVLEGELSIGVNGYFYPNGNSYLENFPNDTSHDPTYGFTYDPNNPGLALVQQGSAALTSYGIKTSGSIVQADLNEVVRRHAQMIEQTALDAGLPFDKIFIHGGGNFTGNYNWTYTTFPYDDIVTNFGKPGWSFYDKAYNPAVAPGLSSALDIIDNTPWAAPEWLYQGGNGGSGKEQWTQALTNTLNYRSNKLLAIYNWEGISGNSDALVALSDVLNTPSSCWLSPAKISSNVSGNNVTLSWEKPLNGAALYLNISNNSNRRPSGSVADINVVNDTITNQTSTVKTLPHGTYYWQVVADGCIPVQRRIAYNSFNIPNPIPGDINHDGKVDILDLARIVNARTQDTILNYSGPEDINGDKQLDNQDLTEFLKIYTHL